MKRKARIILILVIVSVILISCKDLQKTKKDPKSIEVNLDEKGEVISQSQDGQKMIYLTGGSYLYLSNGDSKKLIYENYKEITTNPYSIWDYDEYKIQWSKDNNYIYIIDSIYDVKKDKLIPLDDCVVFSWIDNKGMYLANGTY